MARYDFASVPMTLVLNSSKSAKCVFTSSSDTVVPGLYDFSLEVHDNPLVSPEKRTVLIVAASCNRSSDHELEKKLTNPKVIQAVTEIIAIAAAIGN